MSGYVITNRRRPAVVKGRPGAIATVRPVGTLVAVPEVAHQCYATVVRMRQSRKLLIQPVQCLNDQRAGRLTCQPHRRLEELAQALGKEDA